MLCTLTTATLGSALLISTVLSTCGLWGRATGLPAGTAPPWHSPRPVRNRGQDTSRPGLCGNNRETYGGSRCAIHTGAEPRLPPHRVLQHLSLRVCPKEEAPEGRGWSRERMRYGTGHGGGQNRLYTVTNPQL